MNADMVFASGIVLLAVLITVGFLMSEMQNERRHEELLKKLEELKK